MKRLPILSLTIVTFTIFTATIIPSLIKVVAQQYPPCVTMPRLSHTNGASWKHGATVTVIINPTHFPEGSPQRQKIEDAFRTWQTANTDSGVKFTFTSGSAPTGALNSYYIKSGSSTLPGGTSISNTGSPTTPGNTTQFAETTLNSTMTNPGAIFNIMLHEIGHTFGLDHCDTCRFGCPPLPGPRECDAGPH